MFQRGCLDILPWHPTFLFDAEEMEWLDMKSTAQLSGLYNPISTNSDSEDEPPLSDDDLALAELHKPETTHTTPEEDAKCFSTIVNAFCPSKPIPPPPTATIRAQYRARTQSV